MRISPAAPFKAAHRLRHKIQFDLVYREGSRHGNGCFLVIVRPNNLSYSRLGLSIAAKIVGNAVSRNRIKRAVRESFRLNANQLPKVDVVVNARPGAKSAANTVLTHSLQQVWDKLARHA